MQTYNKNNEISRTVTPSQKLGYCPSFLAKLKNSKQ